MNGVSGELTSTPPQSCWRGPRGAGRRFFAVPGGKIAAVVGKEGEHAVE